MPIPDWLEREQPAPPPEGSVPRAFVPVGGLVFDVGANIGRMTYTYLLCGAGKVIAVEPQLTSCERLHETFDGDERVTIVQGAVGERAETCRLSVYGNGTGTISTFVPEHYWRPGGPWANTPTNATLDVDMTTLDALIETYGVPDFIKVDVEGYERQVLRGLSQAVAALSFEFHPAFRAQATECMERLETLGMGAFNYTCGETMRLELATWADQAGMIAEMERLWSAHGNEYFGNVYARKG